MNEVVVLIPSRNRPELLLKAWESVRDTSRACVLAYVDADQEALYEGLPAHVVRVDKPGNNTYLRVRDSDPRFTIVIGPRFGPVNAINTLCQAVHGEHPEAGLRRLFPQANIFTYMTDDSTIRPAGWDQYLIRTIHGFPNQIGVVGLAHDGGHAEYINFYALSANMVGAIGYYAIPSSAHAWYWDTAMELVGDATRMVYAKTSDVEVIHDYQPTLGSSGLPAEDCERFARWCITERKRIVKAVRERM